MKTGDQPESTYTVDWQVHPHQETLYSSKLLTGLRDLQRRGLAHLRMRYLRSAPTIKSDIVIWDVRRRDNQQRRIVIDLADAPDLFNEWALEESQAYFKRSFVSSIVASRYPNARSKLLPLGLIHSCLSRQTILWLANLSIRTFIAAARSRGGLPQRADWGRLLNGIRMMKGVPGPDQFEFLPTESRDVRAIYQTRVWPPEKSGDDLNALNIQRCDLVRTLRSGLGDLFTGGIMKDPYSEQFCPDVVTENNIYKGAYARFAKRFVVGVYSRGIHNSLAFKLSEYLAGGLCIVSPPFVHELPVPLEAGKHYLPYSSFAECLFQCQHLLNNPEIAQRMSEENLLYYRQWVKPAAHVSDILRRAFVTNART